MKSYKQFINESKNSIESICDKYGIKNYTINSDGSIDVDGDVNLNYNNLTKIPLRFRNVGGDFYCQFNELTTLEYCPQSVEGNFYCSYNKLTSLQGCPRKVVGNFSCSDNQIVSLEGISESSIGINFYCNSNKITDFKGVSEFFEGDLICQGNPIYEIHCLFNHTRQSSIHSSYIKWINEYDVIQGNKIIMDRLEEVYHQFNIEIPKNITFRNYEII